MDGNKEESTGVTQSGTIRWGWIYASVLGCTAVVIVLLYQFSQYYTG